MLDKIKKLGVAATSIKGWLFMLSISPAIATALSGFYEKLPWAHTIALTVLAMAGGVVLVLGGIEILERLGGRKERALLNLGRIRKDATDYLAVACMLAPDDGDLVVIKRFEDEIKENVGLVSKTEVGLLDTLYSFDKNLHPPEFQPPWRSDETLLQLSERVRRVGMFIEKYSGKN